MNYFDIIVGILLLLAAIKGFKDGFIIELASLAALALGIIAAIRFSELTAEFLSGYIHSQYLGIIAFCVTFVGVVIVVHLIAKLVDKLVKAVALGWINRVMGMAFGVLKAGLILSVLLLALNIFGLEQMVAPADIQQESFLYPSVKEAAPRLLDLFRTDLDDILYPNKRPQSPVTT
jgi:membrane protein required for colicin V production